MISDIFEKWNSVTSACQPGPSRWPATAQAPAQTTDEPPIPIAELPPRPKSPADQPQPHQPAENRTDTDEGDLDFDNP